MGTHLVVHLDGRGFVDGDDHRLSAIAAPHEVGDDVFRDGVQAVFPRDEVILSGKLPLNLRFLRIVKFGVLKNALKFFVEVVVGELEFRDAVLVEERHRGAILDRLLEVVD